MYVYIVLAGMRFGSAPKPQNTNKTPYYYTTAKPAPLEEDRDDDALSTPGIRRDDDECPFATFRRRPGERSGSSDGERPKGSSPRRRASRRRRCASVHRV